MLHLKECVVLYGPLSSFSAFAFENNFREIKYLLKNKHQVLQQLFNRFDEIRSIQNLAPNTFAGMSTATRTYMFDKFKLRADSVANSCCFIGHGEAAAVYITEFSVEMNVLRGKRYLQ